MTVSFHFPKTYPIPSYAVKDKEVIRQIVTLLRDFSFTTLMQSTKAIFIIPP